MKRIPYILTAMGIFGLFVTMRSTKQEPRYFPRNSKEYVVFCLPDTLIGHKPETNECGLRRKAYTVYNLDYAVVMCDSCFPSTK